MIRTVSAYNPEFIRIYFFYLDTELLEYAEYLFLKPLIYYYQIIGNT